MSALPVKCEQLLSTCTLTVCERKHELELKLNFRPNEVWATPDKVSYVGRPLPAKDADEHWRRLKSWGLTFGE
jgi:hypothetical protein